MNQTIKIVFFFKSTVKKQRAQGLEGGEDGLARSKWVEGRSSPWAYCEVGPRPKRGGPCDERFETGHERLRR